MVGLPLKHRTKPGCTVRPAKESDLEAATKVCHRIHGHGRSAELREAIDKGGISIVWIFRSHACPTGEEFVHWN
jgi:hypothetical protein